MWYDQNPSAPRKLNKTRTPALVDRFWDEEKSLWAKRNEVDKFVHNSHIFHPSNRRALKLIVLLDPLLLDKSLLWLLFELAVTFVHLYHSTLLCIFHIMCGLKGGFIPTCGGRCLCVPVGANLWLQQLGFADGQVGIREDVDAVYNIC